MREHSGEVDFSPRLQFLYIYHQPNVMFKRRRNNNNNNNNLRLTYLHTNLDIYIEEPHIINHMSCS